ncbi:MAG: TonB-dependent receptor [Desulfuromonadales bacterium]
MRSSRRIHYLPLSLRIIILAVFCLGTSIVHAAPPDEANENSGDLSLEELMEIKVDKVVTASRYEQRVTDAPASITIVTANDIKKYGYRTLADIVKAIPGLYVSYDRNYSYVGVRGFGRAGDYNSRLLILLDGHRLNDNIFDTAALGTELPLDIDLIDHVEFVRGPGSSLYGSNAFFGVINIITRNSSDISRELSAGIGDNAAWKGRASYGARYASGLETMLSASYFDGDGRRNLYYPEYATDPGGPVFHNNDFDSGTSAYSRFSYGNFTLSGLYGTRKKGIPTGAFGTVFDTKPNYSVDDRGYVDLAYRRTFAESVELSSRLYYDAYSYQGRSTYAGSTGQPNVISHDDADGRWMGGEAMATLTAFEGHRLSLGAEFRDNLSMSQINYAVIPYTRYLDDNRRSTSWGIFLQDEYRISGQFLLNVGGRYDRYDHFDAVNPRIALLYQPLASTSFKLLYGEAFRAPNTFESYYNDGGLSSKANLALKPEKIRTYEVVWEQYFGATYNSSVTGFYYRINDLISQVNDPDDGLLVYRNVDRVETRGVELSLKGTWENGLQGQVSYSWQESTNVDTGAWLPNSPRHLAKVNISVPVYRSKLFVSPELQYASPRLTLAGSRTRDPVIVNLTLFSRDLVKGFEASAGIYNLFDTAYGDPGSGEHLQDVIIQDGINFRIKLTCRF